MKRSIILTFLGIFALSAVPPSAWADDAPRGPSAAMLAPVQRWIDAFNAARVPLPEDVFSDEVVITDQFPPYVWSGVNGAHAWSLALNGGLRSARVRSQHVVTEAPRAYMADKSGERASFVLPATLTYDVDGKPNTDRALWLFVVEKASDGIWKIAADTWTRTN